MTSLFSRILSLFFFFELSREGRKAFFGCPLEAVLVAKIEIVAQLLKVISVVPRIHTSPSNEGDVFINQVCRNLSHAMISGFCVSCVSDVISG